MAGLTRAVETPNRTKTNGTWAGYFHLLVIYLVWGSTYLAIRIGVRPGSGFPPFAMGASRLLAAGVLLLLGALATGHSLKISKENCKNLALSGIFLWVFGNGLIMWGEQRANSGYAALLVATAPIWSVFIGSLLDRKWPGKLLVGSLLTGVVGIGVLTAPVIMSGSHSDLLSVAAIIVASLCWACGAVLQQRRPVKLNILVSSGYQQIFGGVGFVIAALILREPLPHPVAAAWWAWAYLLVFGSLLAFTSFVMSFRLLPLTIVMTYAYVNPVVAVVLGWLILHEPLSGWTVGGTMLVLLSVAGVFHDRQK